MDTIKPKSKETIIKLEFEQFANSIGFRHAIADDGRSFNNNPRTAAYKLFCEKYADTVWFEDGNLYKIGFRGSSIDDSSGINVYQNNHVLLNEHDPQEYRAYKNLFWLGIATAAVLTSSTNYFQLVLAFVVTLFIYDQIERVYYKVRFILKK